MNRRRIAWIAWALLLAPFCATPALGNVIFPAFVAPYAVTAIFPALLVAVIVTESLIQLYRERHIGFGGSLRLTLLANAASWIVGVVLSATLLPSGLIKGEPGPAFAFMIWIAISVALVLSILIEAGTLKLPARRYAMRSPLITVTMANITSYLIVTGVLRWGS